MRQVKFAVMLCVLLFPLSAQSASVAGVEIPDQVSVEGFGQSLLLNGAGVRKKFFVSVYVGALYLPQRSSDVERLLAEPPANRVLMHFVFSKVGKHKLDEGWREGFEDNLDPTHQAAIAERLESFVALFGDMHEGDTVWLDYVPGHGTSVSVNGVRKGVIEGRDFNSALLSVWLGREPVSESLKNAMVGVDKG